MTLKELETRIKLFTELPIDSLDRTTLQARTPTHRPKHGNRVRLRCPIGRLSPNAWVRSSWRQR